jgi:hypothetical protein
VACGTLSAFQQPTSQGFEWRVQLDGTSDHLDGQPVQSPPQPAVHVDSIEEPSPAAVTEPALLKTLDLVDRLQRENLELAGQVGFLQAKLQAAEQRILLLEARPPEVQTVDVAGNDGQPVVHEAGQVQPAEMKRKPWWQRLFNQR